MAEFLDNSIFWIETGKIQPNPYQPRREFDEEALQSLADSIRQYGVLQALVVTRREEERDDGGIAVHYELISGERRLRASKLAGVAQVPAIIKTGEESDSLKLELAIIENLQREDLNPLDRAKAFAQLVDKFGLKHSEVGKKVGKSREYVSNSIRLLQLPEEALQALSEGKITEGHARPLLMLIDRPEEQTTLYKEIIYKRLTVRDAEKIARSIAKDRVRKVSKSKDPHIESIEEQLSEQLGTRVHIQQNKNGGKLEIDFFTKDDLQTLLTVMSSGESMGRNAMLKRFDEQQQVAGQSGGEDEMVSDDENTTSETTHAETDSVDYDITDKDNKEELNSENMTTNDDQKQNVQGEEAGDQNDNVDRSDFQVTKDSRDFRKDDFSDDTLGEDVTDATFEDRDDTPKHNEYHDEESHDLDNSNMHIDDNESEEDVPLNSVPQSTIQDEGGSETVVNDAVVYVPPQADHVRPQETNIEQDQESGNDKEQNFDEDVSDDVSDKQSNNRQDKPFTDGNFTV
jgi:ParB family chromosome partitioning protein